MAELEALYRRYGLIVERRCARILGSAADGRDAAHEAFARAAEKLSSYRAEGDRMAWLYRISTYVCLNVLRERKTRGADWLSEVRQSQSQFADGEQQAVEKQAAIFALKQAEDDVTRQLALYVFVDEMSQGEAADLCGISRATANARLGRFRHTVRQALEANP